MSKFREYARGFERQVRDFFKARPRFSYFCLAIAASLVPLAISLFLHAMQNTGVSIFHAIPQYSDELFYYSQAAGTVKYGAPLGYFGYSGTHAPIGTFGAWGIATIIPYVLYGLIAGWTYYSMAGANILFLTLSVFAFIMLAHPDKKTIGWLSLANLTAFFIHSYFYTSMSMPLRYSCAIVLVGMFARLYLYETRKWFRFIAVPLAVFVISLIYYPFLVFIPPLVMARAKTKKDLACRALISLPVTAVCSAATLYINKLTSAPYFLEGNEAMDFVKEALEYPGAAIPLAFRRLMNKAVFINPFNMLFNNPPNNPTPLSPFRLFAISLLWIALIVLIYFVLKHKDGRHSTVFYMSGLYFLVSMTAGSLLLNCHSDFGNFLRETSIAYIAALYAAALCLDRKFIKIVALVSILGIVPFWTIEYYPSFGTTRYATASDIAYYDQRAETYANYIIVDPESDDPWDNTVAFDRSSNSLPPILWMPTGIGCNLSVLDKTDDGKLPSPAKYIVTCDGSCNGDGECTHKETTDYLLALGYKLLYRDTDTHNAIFERPDSLDKISS